MFISSVDYWNVYKRSCTTMCYSYLSNIVLTTSYELLKVVSIIQRTTESFNVSTCGSQRLWLTRFSMYYTRPAKAFSKEKKLWGWIWWQFTRHCQEVGSLSNQWNYFCSLSTIGITSVMARPNIRNSLNR